MGLSLVQRIGPVDPGKTDFRHRLLALVELHWLSGLVDPFAQHPTRTFVAVGLLFALAYVTAHVWFPKPSGPRHRRRRARLTTRGCARSGIAAIPVMAFLGRRLTGDVTLGVLAGAVTALNPLLAFYTVFVHQYSFECLLTALFINHQPPISRLGLSRDNLLRYHS